MKMSVGSKSRLKISAENGYGVKGLRPKVIIVFCLVKTSWGLVAKLLDPAACRLIRYI
jgi:hypothetical protein